MDTTDIFLTKIDRLINKQLSSDGLDTNILRDLIDVRSTIQNQIQSRESQKSFRRNYRDVTKLREIVQKVLLHEFKLDKSTKDKINEFGELSDKIDDIKHQLGRIKKRYGELEDELRPILEELEDHQQKSLKTEEYLVTIKRRGYTRESYKYKKSFEESLTKVNKQTRVLLEDLLKSTKSTSRVLSSVGVQRLGESSFLNTVVRKVKGFFKNVFRSLRKTDRDLNTLQTISRKIVRN